MDLSPFCYGTNLNSSVGIRISLLLVDFLSSLQRMPFQDHHPVLTLNLQLFVTFLAFLVGAQEYSSRTAGVTVGTAVTVIVIVTLLLVCIASYVIQRKLEEEQQKNQLY